jgi:hypothetical protein
MEEVQKPSDCECNETKIKRCLANAWGIVAFARLYTYICIYIYIYIYIYQLLKQDTGGLNVAPAAKIQTKFA